MKMIHHFKGIKEEMPVEKKTALSKKDNKPFYWGMIEEIRRLLNK